MKTFITTEILLLPPAEDFLALFSIPFCVLAYFAVKFFLQNHIAAELPI
jgi:hypothetical protein